MKWETDHKILVQKSEEKERKKEITKKQIENQKNQMQTITKIKQTSK